MKLYTYDHCPYCVKARMIFGLRGIGFEHNILANDDETTPISLIGKKMVPILVKKDGSAMGESLDIVRYIDNLSGQQLDPDIRPDIHQWLQTIRNYANHLIMPRAPRLGLAEFATQSSIDYYTERKTAIIGDFNENLARSPHYIEYLNTDLDTLAPHIKSPGALKGHLSMEDIEIFATLRLLTAVRGVLWPQPVRTYMETLSARCNIPLFYDRAI
ncbi:MAG: glutaredoxin 2 [Cardiobacteriaceae bacterium]|nr:glutaredoxin 2 [Cardiobacteriaceae bacterium]